MERYTTGKSGLGLVVEDFQEHPRQLEFILTAVVRNKKFWGSKRQDQNFITWREEVQLLLIEITHMVMQNGWVIIEKHLETGRFMSEICRLLELPC